MTTGPEPPEAQTPGSPPSRKERILTVLGDSTARYLLGLLDREPRSVPQLLEANHIPQSTLYRKLHELRELGLVGIQTSVRTEDARRLDFFRSLVEEVRVTMRGDFLDLQVRYRDLNSERLRTLWGQLQDEVRR